MNKTAAIRSQARRAALTKVALGPAQVLGYAGMLGGGALAGDAAMNGEQSTLKRVGKGVLGAGLAYAGHKALTDPTAQGIIRSGTQRGMDFVRRFLGKEKAAEARAEKRALDNVGSEIAGSILSPVTGGLTGAGVAALVAALRGKNVRRAAGGGALLGATMGAPLLEAGGVLAGVLRRRRTRKEQQEHDSKSHWENFLPGVAAYNRTKRMGRVLAGVGEPDEPEKKAAEAAYLAGFCKAAEALGTSPLRLAMHMAVKEAVLKPGAAFRLVRTALEGRRGSELGGKVLATRSFLSGTGRLSRGTADNLAHMLRLDKAMKGATNAGYLPYKGKVSLPDLVRAAHLDVSGVESTPRSEAVRSLLREMGYSM